MERPTARHTRRFFPRSPLARFVQWRPRLVMRNCNLLLALALYLVCSLLAGCPFDPNAARQRYFDDALNKVIESNAKTVPVAGLTDFDWTEVCVAVPYGMSSIPGITQDDVNKNISWVNSESYWGLLYMGPDGKLAAAAKIDRRKANYGKDAKNANCIERDRAKVVVERNGAIRLELISM